MEFPESFLGSHSQTVQSQAHIVVDVAGTNSHSPETNWRYRKMDTVEGEEAEHKQHRIAAEDNLENQGGREVEDLPVKADHEDYRKSFPEVESGE
jgi:hypothetical protein